MTARLALVPPDGAPPRRETVSQRVRRLQAEAKAAAKEQARVLQAHLLKTQLLAAEIAAGGDAYPAGVRELARALVAEAESRVFTLEAIVARNF